ncbi:hypothetical protein CRUP_008194 [Coryphaenoides rupestris]|nr:hypothetical protein CRUP_008194 [Coryphaenoides rupestris]
MGTFNSYDWVSKYTLLYGDRPDAWTPYVMKGGNSTLPGNWNYFQVKRNVFHYAFTAKHIRLLPLAWNTENGGKIGVRLELFGCSYDSYVLQYNGDDTVIYMFPEKRSHTLRDHYAINFKTLEQDGLLLHSEGVQGDMVTLELKRGRLYLHISLGYRLNDGYWHTVDLAARDNLLTLTIDEEEGSPLKINNPFTIRTGDRYFFGGCPKTNNTIRKCETKLNHFHGCMQQIYIDNEQLDIDLILQRQWGRYAELLIGTCGITDRCTPNPCEHEGRCIQSWDDFICLSYKAWTVIHHDRVDGTKVSGSSVDRPYIGNVNYWNASWDEVTALANTSMYCEQWIDYSCYKSRLLNTPNGRPFGYWIGRNNESHYYWGGADSDKGYLDFRDHLPVRRVVVGDTNRTNSEVQYTVGPLRCHGDRNIWNTVSFTKPTYITFPTFQPGSSADISFHFKTYRGNCVFLENSDEQLRNFLRIELNCPPAATAVGPWGPGTNRCSLKDGKGKQSKEEERETERGTAAMSTDSAGVNQTSFRQGYRHCTTAILC